MTAINTLGLANFVKSHPRLFVLTGAGVSTDSGIPDYRDKDGSWKSAQPIHGPDFIADENIRKRYWARSLAGWRHFGKARPNKAHKALSVLEKNGYIQHLVTQNVDRLHQLAGSRSVTDLHGRLDRVVCLQCNRSIPRSEMQTKLERQNPGFVNLKAEYAPDGDAKIESTHFELFNLVPCDRCGGILKPEVVFYGENVPPDRVERAMAELGQSNAVMVVGSSLMVYSGFRFCRAAISMGLPMAAINLGKTRADDLLDVKISANCGESLQQLLHHLIVS